MHFGEYCRVRDIPQNGNHIRMLDKLNDEFKCNLSPSSTKPSWAVYVEEADKVFGND